MSDAVEFPSLRYVFSSETARVKTSVMKRLCNLHELPPRNRSRECDKLGENAVIPPEVDCCPVYTVV